MATCHAFYKDYVKAATYFSKFLDLQPDDASVMGTYGRTLAMSGKPEEAKTVLEKALHLAEAKNEEQLIEQVCA